MWKNREMGTAELACILGVSERTVRMLARNDLPCRRRGRVPIFEIGKVIEYFREVERAANDGDYEGSSAAANNNNELNKGAAA